MTSSSDSPRSERNRDILTLTAVVSCLAAVVFASVWFCFAQGYILYYGDAQAHLNISRSIIDSKTPGYEQIGSVWLPLLHVLCLPFVGNNAMWTSGLAGSIPVAVCFVLACASLFVAALETYADRVAAVVATACFALNPNVLYLASIPMTEIVFLAGLFVLLTALCRYRSTHRSVWIVLGIVALWAMTLTRYDGWFLIPFAGIWFAGAALPEQRIRVLVTIAALATLSPLYWMAHCWWMTGNALDFFNGPYSAKAIQAGKLYPGYQDWGDAFRYYAAASRDCAGPLLVALGVLGGACALAKQRFITPCFLLLTPAFYVWSLHSAGTPIFVPELWPHGLYNSRYGIAAVALTAFLAGAVVLVLPVNRRGLAALIPVVALLPWLVHFSVNNVICWRESEVNSIARRAWTNRAARFLEANYQPGAGILASFGDLTGIFCRAGIPLKEIVHEGNGPLWMISIKRPDLIHTTALAITQSGSPTGNVFANTSTYLLSHTIEVPGAPQLHFYRRNTGVPANR